MPRERILVTAALPYANGPIHIGHAIGCYVPADVYVRYHRMLGDDVIYICGTDEHGTPISVAAEQEGITPKELVDKYHKMHLEAFDSIGVRFDNFSGTARPMHYELSQDFFRRILDKGLIYKKSVLRPYCPNCRRFLPDRYVKGVCPKCGAQDERGDQCEKCSTQLEPHELKSPYCVICRNTPQMRETAHWFFKLSELSEPLRQWVEANRHWPSNARTFALGWIRDGLQDRAITRDLNWGIPVPAEGAEGKVLYVWFDAPIGYISSTKEWAQKIGKPEEWKRYWLDKDTKIVHFIGKDNIPFHTVIWPAELLAYGGVTMPWQIASNEFLNLEGRKMSTSRSGCCGCTTAPGSSTPTSSDTTFWPSRRRPQTATSRSTTSGTG
jgi:methionyl-tRNA synthetase